MRQDEIIDTITNNMFAADSQIKASIPDIFLLCNIVDKALKIAILAAMKETLNPTILFIKSMILNRLAPVSSDNSSNSRRRFWYSLLQNISYGILAARSANKPV